jgi:hypothetical protein
MTEVSGENSLEPFENSKEQYENKTQINLKSGQVENSAGENSEQVNSFSPRQLIM